MSHSPDPLRLSGRSHFGEPSDELRARLLQSQAHPEPIDLSITSPGRVGLPHLSLEPLAHASALPYHPECRGSHKARLALTESYLERAPLLPEELLLTASTSDAYSYLLHALCDPGDAILVPTPSYPLFAQLARLASVELVPYRLAYDGSWHVDRASLPSARAIQEKRIRAVFAVSPNNPTGSVLSSEEWHALTGLRLPLIVDEVFRLYLSSSCRGDFLADPLRDPSPHAPTVVLDGLSKRALAPGLKLAWLSARGPGSTELLARLEMIADTFLSLQGPVQNALPEYLRREVEIRQALLERIAENEETLRTTLAESSLTLLGSDGAWMRIVRFPNIATEEEWLAQFSEQGIFAHPGSLYDLPHSPSFVLSLILEATKFRAGIKRLVRLASEHEKAASP